MKMVSASKLHKVQQVLLPLKEYRTQYTTLLHAALQDIDRIGLSHSLTAKKTSEPQHLLLIVVTSDRGLCGAFNKNVLKSAHHYIESLKQTKGTSIEVLVVGKKAYQFFKKSTLPLIDRYVHLLTSAGFNGSSELTTYCIDAFQRNYYTEILLIYTAFKNAAKQEVIIAPFLPFLLNRVEYSSNPLAQPSHYIYEPSQQLLIEKLIPEVLRNKVMSMLVESSASEHTARMMTMGKASDNANELLKELRTSYNRTRQASITNALAEITSGAEALIET
jgi:F-type H+-transporting ATPase subunit gamma